MLDDWQRDAQRLLTEAQGLGVIDTGDFVDHLGVKAGSIESYHELKSQLASCASLLGEVNINGRPIATFQLKNAIRVGLFKVPEVELMAPKNGESKNGFDHIEVVIQEEFAMRKKRFPSGRWSSVRWPSLANPEIALELEHGVVKFHFQTLQRVVELEHAHPEILNIKVPAPDAYKTWVFDLDGTLFSSVASVVDGVWEFSKQKGLTVSREWVASQMQPTYQEYLRAIGIENPNANDWLLLEQCEARYMQSATPVRPIFELLKSVKEHGAKTALWTARFRLSTELLLKRHGLTSCFDALFTASDCKKPSRLPWILERATSCLLIGDSRSDEEGARANGISLLKLPHGFHSRV